MLDLGATPRPCKPFSLPTSRFLWLASFAEKTWLHSRMPETSRELTYTRLHTFWCRNSLKKKLSLPPKI